MAARLLAGDMRLTEHAVRYAAVVGILALVAASAFALPDLEPEIYGVNFDGSPDHQPTSGDVAEGCAGGTTDRLLLRFGVRFHNIGPDALVIGDPLCPDCAVNPGVMCGDPRFICSPAEGHDHPHLIGFADYALYDFQGNVLREGGKKSFCVEDNACPDGNLVFDCSNQGISPGCTDDYNPSLGCQYIDVTDVPNVTNRALRLRATLDPNDTFPDADRSNNAVEVVIPGCGDGIVQPGEQCDPAATPVDPCCQADCTLAPPGSPCEAPVGPCGTPDAPSPDGTSCGPGAPPCLLQVCHAGACATEPGSGGCLIGATCLLPGAPDPVDACQRCDPALRTDSYSANVDPDPAGLQCQATRLTRVLFGTTCSQRIERRVDRPLLRIHQSVNRLSGASPAVAKRLARRLARDVTRLDRAQHRATQSGCDLGTFAHEVHVLVGQLSAYGKSVR